MQRFRLLGLALMAIFALGAVAASTASAEEGGNPLILATFPLTFESVESESKTVLILETAKTKIECQKSTISGEVKEGEKKGDGRLGTATVHFKGCKQGEAACQTGAVKEEILLENADIHFVDILINNKLTLGLWLLPLPNPFTFKCGIVKSEVRGSLIGEVTSEEGTEEENKEKTLLILTKHLLLLWKTTKEKTGEQSVKECDLTKEFCLEKGVNKKFNLEANIGLGFEKAAEITHILILFKEKVHIHW